MLRQFALVAVVILAAGCGEDSPHTVADYVKVDKRLSSMEQALREAGLLSTLDGSGPITLFAYVNGDFDSSSVEEESLATLLNYHIHDGELTAEQLKERTAIPTTEGDEIHVRYGVDGILLNDGAVVVGPPIVASNGIIHVLDRALERTLVTDTKVFESKPDLLLEGFAADYINVEDTGFVHDLRVFVDIEHTDVSNLFVFLQHADTGAFIWLLQGTTANLDNMDLRFADSASHHIGSDGIRGEAGGEAFPEAAYQASDPLEFMVGVPLAGQWELGVINVGDGETESHLREWGLIATAGEDPPGPAIVFNPRRRQPSAFAHGFTEAAVVETRRVGGLAGEVTLKGSAGDLLAQNSTIAEERRVGALLFPIPASAEIGDRSVAISAEVGEVSRILSFNVRVTAPRSDGIELLAHVPLPLLGALGGAGSDIWGWTDPVTGSEIALVGTTVGTAFVDISEPEQPVVLGTLPTESEASTWRDIKVYQDHAFIVSEAFDHGLQVFDLTQLRTATENEVFVPTAHNADFGNAHNIAINEESATAYVVGTDFEGCHGGMLRYDISTPTQPVSIGCFSGAVTNGQAAGPSYPTDVYSHDVQCVTYQGPDTDYTGRELCFSSDQDSIGIADFSAESPAQIVRLNYDGVGYTHQGWLTEDHRYFIVNDEYDEIDLEINTRSYVWDMFDLDKPELAFLIENPSNAVGHNTYVASSVAYQANYTSGLRLVDLSAIASGAALEVASYDTYPDDDEECRSTFDCGLASFDGAWSSYPFFESGVVVVSDTRRGLFVLRQSN